MKRGLGLIDPSVLLLPDQVLLRIRKYGAGLELSSSYGLFRRMTGVGGRPELIFEGSSDGVLYEEYDFNFKTGNVSTSPHWVLPHQPRLAW
jgi:hypothetical protein